MEVDCVHRLIKKRKNKHAKTIEVPFDWISLIENASTKLRVHEMKHETSHNFADVLKNELVYRKTDSKNNIRNTKTFNGLEERNSIREIFYTTQLL